MSFGIQTWDSQGNMMLDTSSFAGRMYGKYQISCSNSVGTVTVLSIPGYALDGNWFFYCEGGAGFLGLYVTPINGGLRIEGNMAAISASTSTHTFYIYRR